MFSSTQEKVKKSALGRSDSLKNQLPFSREKRWIGISPANNRTHETLSVSQKKSIPLRLNLHIIKFPILSIHSFFSKYMHPQENETVVPSCPTLCNPMDYSPWGFSVHRILEWEVVPFSRGSSQPRYQTGASCIVGRFFTIWATREVLHCKTGKGLVCRIYKNYWIWWWTGRPGVLQFMVLQSVGHDPTELNWTELN